MNSLILISPRVKKNNTDLKNIIVQEDHDYAGDVKGAERGVDDEVTVVEEAEVRQAVGRVVEAQDNGGPDGRADHPH